MADTQAAVKAGLHHRMGGHEPGLTGGVSRGDQVTEAGKRPVAPAAQASTVTSSLAFLGHGALAIAFAAMAVLLALAPETVAEMAFGRAATLLGPSEEAVKSAVGEAARGNMKSAAHQAWQAATGGASHMLSPQLDFLLRLASTGPFMACMILLTLQNAARQGKLTHPLYARLNLGMVASASSLLGLLWLKRHLLTWPTFMVMSAMQVSKLAMTLPPLLQAGPRALLRSLPSDLRTARTRRSALYAITAALFFVEGLGILGTPATMLRAASGSPGTGVSHLFFQAIALSTHVLVPAAALCLKILTDSGHLTSVANLLLNLGIAGAGLQHVLLFSRATAAGMVGPAGPLLLLAWGSALATALYNTPVKIDTSE